MHFRLSEIMFGNIVATTFDPFRAVSAVLRRFQAENAVSTPPERFFQLLAL